MTLRLEGCSTKMSLVTLNRRRLDGVDEPKIQEKQDESFACMAGEATPKKRGGEHEVQQPATTKLAAARSGQRGLGER